jgi:heat shock protein HslJ
MKFQNILVLVVIIFFTSACGGADVNKGDFVPTEPDGSIESEVVESLTMIVGSEKADCVGEAPQECLMVNFHPEDEWQLFYDQIEGFDYLEGYTYTLKVERYQVENPPADGSSLRYVLVEVVDKTERPMQKEDNLAGQRWVLESYGNPDNLTAVLPDSDPLFQYDAEARQMSGTTGCNNFFGSATIDEQKQTISFGPMGMTRMACTEDQNLQEISVINLLENVIRFEFDNEKLILITENEEVLVYSSIE